MPSLDKVMANGIARANLLKRKADVAFAAYSKACEEYNWVRANEMHIQAITHMELYLDEIGALYKRLEVETSG